MRTRAILITGANGEIGHSLIRHLARTQPEAPIVALDLHPMDPSLAPLCRQSLQGDILDQILLKRLVLEHEFQTIYHLAAILSTRAEFHPEVAHRVNVEGTLQLLQMAGEQTTQLQQPVQFIYPSTIAVYGLPSVEVKKREGAVVEHVWNAPRTMYGANKLYCEHLGRYYSRFVHQLVPSRGRARLDFRAVRFPGLISAQTEPSGGTSDYGPEMLHNAARNQPYRAFVRPDTTIPFMAMPDAVQALIRLAAAPRERLQHHVYNVTSFSASAADLRQQVLAAFPGAEISFEPEPPRQLIVDSWPAALDDGAARREWDWAPRYDHETTFTDYLIPGIRARYAP